MSSSVNVSGSLDTHHSVESKYFASTIGSLTERGGRVTRATSRIIVAGLELARIGDTVTYKDGSETTIVDGAGFAAVSGDKPLALVGSRLSNGDVITESLQDCYAICVPDGGNIPGLFDPAYTPAQPHQPA